MAARTQLNHGHRTDIVAPELQVARSCARLQHFRSSCEDDFSVVFGVELDCGKRGEGDRWEQVATSQKTRGR